MVLYGTLYKMSLSGIVAARTLVLEVDGIKNQVSKSLNPLCTKIRWCGHMNHTTFDKDFQKS